jgi:DNA-binding NtrC family response regulator
VARILVVDDDPGTRVTFQRILSLHGHAVTAAANGRTAAKFLTERRFDLVLLDARLPDISGFDVLAQVSKKTNGCPIVIVTGYGSVAASRRAFRLGAADLVRNRSMKLNCWSL